MEGLDASETSGFDGQHAGFVTSVMGTSPIEILHVLFSISITPLLTSLLTPWVVPASFIPMSFGDTQSRNFIRALIEYPVVGILPLLLITVLAGHADETEKGFYQQLSYCMPSVLVLTCIGIIIVNHSITRPKWNSLTTQWTRIQDKPITASTNNASRNKINPSTPHIPFLTTFRAMIIYITVLSIIAVDFKIFPRRFAKTKIHGFSLMDVGTGSFIFANGIVSPEARKLCSNFRQSLISSIPLVILGLVRLLSVKGVEYREVEEEYGVHWNFFFTLAAVKLFSSFIFRFIRVKHSMKLGFIIGLTYEAFIVFTGFQQNYLLNSAIPRTGSLIDANREGIFSTVGYTCIYFMSVYCGQLIYHGRIGRTRFRDWVQYAMVSGVQAIFLWFLVYLTHNHWNASSRRAGNFAYVLWSVASNYTVLWFHVVFFLIQHLLQHTGLIYGPLLFYQLAKSSKLIKERKLKEEIQDSRRRNQEKCGPEAEQEDDVPTELELIKLEGKAKLLEEKMKAQTISQMELEELAEEIDKEMTGVQERYKTKGNSFGEALKEIKESKVNLAYLPDLTLPPISYTAICYNGLLVFLLGNLLTGGINMSVVAMYTPSAIALVILWSYATLIIITSVVLYFYQIQLKFW